MTYLFAILGMVVLWGACKGAGDTNSGTTNSNIAGNEQEHVECKFDQGRERDNSGFAR